MLRTGSVIRGVLKNPLGAIGLIMLAVFAFIAVLAPHLVPHDPTETGASAEDLMKSPSVRHLMGTDNLGRDVFSRVLFASRVSMLVGILAAAISIGIGTVLGVVSGYFRGLVGELIMRFTDVFLVLPFIPLVIVLAAIFGRSVWNIILVLGMTSWPQAARIIRSETLSIRERAFIERARAVGCRDVRIIWKHVLPNVMPLAIANAVLTVALAILSEATLSFIGLGDPTMISWGNMLNSAFRSNATLVGAWWFVIAPGLAIVLLAVSFAFVGHALDDAMNPKLGERKV